MRHYRATNIDTGEVVEYDAELPQDAHRMHPWVVEDVSTAGPSLDGPLPETLLKPEDWLITKLAFRRRFTAIERIGVTFAAKQPTEQGAYIQAYLDDVQSAPYINLKGVETRAGVLGLEQAGLLQAGRATVILDTLPTSEEQHHG